MVVCGAAALPAIQASCAVNPASLLPFAPGVCPMSPTSCAQRFQATTIFPGTHILTPSPTYTCSDPSVPPPVLQCGQGMTSNNRLNCMTTSPVVPCSQAIPCSSPMPTPPMMNQGFRTSPLISCTQRLVSPSVLSCTPGMCPLTQTTILPAGTLCPVVPTSSTLCPLNSSMCSIVTAPSWKQSYGMEQVWNHEFRTLFSLYTPHSWILLPVNQKPNGLWNANVDSAKVRFCCEHCGHGWTSMKGRVAFWFILNQATAEGIVCLKLYGQQCDRCKKGNYEPAMWYPEEVIKVIVNIYNRVGQVYYGFQQAPYHRARRPGKPRTPHNSDLCQACKDGVCAERR